MKKRFMPTLVAFIALVILVIYANKYEVDEILPPGQQKPTDLVNYKLDEIKSISFGKGADYPLKVEFSGSDSTIVLPSKYSCDNAEAFGVARHFNELKSEYAFSENATDTKTFGITEESLKVKIEATAGVVELTLGSKVSVGNSLYLKKTGDPNIYIVPAHIKGSFEKTLNDLRDRALYNEDFGKVNEIQYNNGSEELLLALDSVNSDWKIAKSKYSADNVAVANLINDMRNLRISTFIDGKDLGDSKYELENPSLSIVMKNESGKTYALKAGALQGTETYLTSDGINVQLANTLKVNELRLGINDLREKFLDVYHIASLTAIEASDATGSIKLVREKSDWFNGDKKVAENDVKDFVNILARAKVEEFLPKSDSKKYGLEDLTKCSKVVLTAKENKQNYWFGTNTGLVTFIQTDEEVVKINGEVNNALEKLFYRLRQQ